MGWERQHEWGSEPSSKDRKHKLDDCVAQGSWPAAHFHGMCQKPETRQELLSMSQESRTLIQKAKPGVTAWPGECSVTEEDPQQGVCLNSPAAPLESLIMTVLRVEGQTPRLTVL